MGAGLDGLQLDVRILHRPGGPGAGAEPATRRDRRRGDAARGDGVHEITLLGQNVNSWGRDLRAGDPTEFGELLRACDAVDGIERIRFTSPHPKDFRAPVDRGDVRSARASASTFTCRPSRAPSRVLKAMRRTYDRDRYLRLVETLRAAIPDLALGTALIVGFPGETDDDFEETLSLVEEVRFDSAFTFIYSPRAGTEAASMSDPGPGRR